MLRFSLLFVGTFIFFCACSEAPPEQTAPVTEEPTKAEQTPSSQISPPPPVCVYLTEATVLSYFDETVKLPMPGRRSAAEYASCQYDLEAPGWSAALVVELPDPGGKQQAIIDEVAGARGADKATLTEATGRFSNEGRILSVSGKKHFRIKFSALPKPGTEPPFDEAGRRELLLKMARGVLAV